MTTAAGTRPIPVLAYHAVEDRFALDITTLNCNRFARQLSCWRRQQVRPISLTEYLEREGRQQLDERLLLLTFDDGYASWLENVYPLLEQYAFPAVLFPVAGYAGRVNRWDAARFGRRRLHLSLDQLRELAQRGYSIGNHSWSHCGRLSLPDELVRREWGAADKLLRESGLQPVAAAWTFGRESAIGRELLAANGYSVAFSLAGGDSWPWRVPRLACYRFSSFPFSYEKTVALYEGRRLWQRIPNHCNRLTGLFQRHCQKILVVQGEAD